MRRHRNTHTHTGTHIQVHIYRHSIGPISQCCQQGDRGWRKQDEFSSASFHHTAMTPLFTSPIYLYTGCLPPCLVCARLFYCVCVWPCAHACVSPRVSAHLQWWSEVRWTPYTGLLVVRARFCSPRVLDGMHNTCVCLVETTEVSPERRNSSGSLFIGRNSVRVYSTLCGTWFPCHLFSGSHTIRNPPALPTPMS